MYRYVLLLKRFKENQKRLEMETNYMKSIEK